MTMYRYFTFVSLLLAVTAFGQSFNSGSTGVDGDLIVNTPGVTVFNQMSQGGGTTFNFKSIQIAAGSTLRLSGQIYQNPLVFLAQNAVTIGGTLDLSGEPGPVYVSSNVSLRVPSTPGAGGFSGGLGSFGSNPAQPGNGPGGGGFSVSSNCQGIPLGGAFSGNSFLVPLVGGSGGAGGAVASGGAGGGALLIASSVSITVTGSITAQGGVGSSSGSGAGGAIRLVAPTITGTGSLSVVGGPNNYGCNGTNNAGGAGSGVIRLEAFQNTFNGFISGPFYDASPFNLFLPSANPSVLVASIGGVPVNTSPTGSFTVPDVTVNSSSPLPVQIQAQNIPLGTTVTLFIFSENGPDQTLTSTGLAGTVANSTATASVTLPPGFSRGFAKATWTQ
jgi:hypothetical protein